MAVSDAPRRGPSRFRVGTALLVTLATLTAAASLGTAKAEAVHGDPEAARSAAAAAAVTGAAATAATVTPLTLHQTVPTTFTFPGAAPQLAWPSRGQAALSVVGIGSLGTSGPTDSPVPIASITKTMTAYLVLQDHPLADGQNGPTITVSAAQAAAYRKEAAQTEDSVVPVKAGEKLTERDALYALMLASADNVAQILAQWDAGSVPAFLARMNATAAAFGMRHTTFTDPSGLAASTLSTASDLVLLGENAMQWADFRELVATRWAVIPVAGLVKNYNALLGTDGVIGIKTGSTSAAGSCLLFAATVTVGGQAETVVGAVLGQYLGSGKGLLTSAMNAAGKLVVSGENALGTAKVAAPGATVADVGRGQAAVSALTVAAPVTVIGWPGLGYRVSVVGSPEQASIMVTAEGAGTGTGAGAQGGAGAAAATGSGRTDPPGAVSDAGSPPAAFAPLRPAAAGPSDQAG